MDPDRLKDWGTWRRNLVYWGTGRFDTREDPRGKVLDVFEPHLVEVEIVEERYLSLCKVYSSEARIAAQRYVFEWSLQKISSQWRFSNYSVRNKLEHAEMCLLGLKEIPSSKDKRDGRKKN